MKATLTSVIFFSIQTEDHHIAHLEAQPGAAALLSIFQ